MGLGFPKIRGSVLRVPIQGMMAICGLNYRVIPGIL